MYANAAAPIQLSDERIIGLSFAISDLYVHSWKNWY